MMALFSTGRVVDLILLFIFLEAVFIAIHRGKTGRGVRLREVASGILSGVFLLLALRCALVGERWPWIATWLLAALIAHFADLAGRRPR
jgi:uncharacterized membrane protein YobD (UPF0266 family)